MTSIHKPEEPPRETCDAVGKFLLSVRLSHHYTKKILPDLEKNFKIFAGRMLNAQDLLLNLVKNSTDENINIRIDPFCRILDCAAEMSIEEQNALADQLEKYIKSRD